VNRVLTYSTFCNRYLCRLLQPALVICGVLASRAMRRSIVRLQGLCGKETLLFSAIGAAGPDAQLFAQMCLSFIGVVSGMALAYPGRNRRGPRERYE
jgi:hypothetical protein